MKVKKIIKIKKMIKRMKRNLKIKIIIILKNRKIDLNINKQNNSTNQTLNKIF
jgi:hypothetical protein